MDKDLLALNARNILDSLNDGVYVTDRDRRIVFWNAAAERITDWKHEDVVDSICSDNILCHMDKDGHDLCGEEHCPLYRAMQTGASSDAPLFVFASKKGGERIPLQVSVAPIRDENGIIVGAVESFRDMTNVYDDYRRAHRIQSLALRVAEAQDSRCRVSVHFLPQDIVGGDFYCVERVDEDRTAFIVADMTGHGVASALYTMHLHSLWEEYRTLLSAPTTFVETLNGRLHNLLKEDVAFASTTFGLFDGASNTCSLVCAGNPSPLLYRSARGEIEPIDSPGTPLGLLGTTDYEEVSFVAEDGDALLLYSDGATEVHDHRGRQLGVEGLIGILKNMDYFRKPPALDLLEGEILRYSNRIRFDDDLTLLEVRFRFDMTVL